MTAPATDQGKVIAYVVLVKDGEGNWHETQRGSARDSNSAVKAVASKGVGEPGTFVAVPARSFNPVKVTPHTVITLEIEDAA